MPSPTPAAATTGGADGIASPALVAAGVRMSANAIDDRVGDAAPDLGLAPPPTLRAQRQPRGRTVGDRAAQAELTGDLDDPAKQSLTTSAAKPVSSASSRRCQSKSRLVRSRAREPTPTWSQSTTPVITPVRARTLLRFRSPCTTSGQAASAGGKIAKPAQVASWGGYSGYFADPDGNLWKVAAPA
jgi:hypothetical protein